jgi:chemotaxis protein CheD
MDGAAPPREGGRKTGGLASVFLQPGDYFVGTNARVRTILGSCVSITLWHPGFRVGAMSHFVLASRSTRGSASLDARYGEEALELMARELAAFGVRPADCEGKIFGGGDMFPDHTARFSGLPPIGRRNGEAAWSMLEARGVRISSQHLYGSGHRNIVFDVSSGHVWVRHVKKKPGDNASEAQSGWAP